MIITISLSDWVYETYLRNHNGNRSKFIEGCFVKGFEISTGKINETKKRILELHNENQILQQQINKQKAEIGKLKKKRKKYNHDGPDTSTWHPDLIVEGL